MSRILGVLVPILVIGAFIAICIAVEANSPKTSRSVVIVKYNTARLHPGEVLVIRTPNGKSVFDRSFRYDGDETVTVSCSFFCDEVVTLKPGEEVKASAGQWREPFYLVQVEPWSVDIRWPEWSYIRR